MDSLEFNIAITIAIGDEEPNLLAVKGQFIDGELDPVPFSGDTAGYLRIDTSDLTYFLIDPPMAYQIKLVNELMMEWDDDAMPEYNLGQIVERLIEYGYKEGENFTTRIISEAELEAEEISLERSQRSQRASQAHSRYSK